jgi:hypothetical protein
MRVLLALEPGQATVEKWGLKVIIAWMGRLFNPSPGPEHVPGSFALVVTRQRNEQNLFHPRSMKYQRKHNSTEQ